MLNTREVSDMLVTAGIRLASGDVAKLAQSQAFPGAIKVRGTWEIPLEAVNIFIANRKRRLRWLGGGTIVSLLLFVFTGISATKDGRDLLKDLFPKSTPVSLAPKISHVILGEDDTSYKLETTVNNPSTEEVLIKSISMTYDRYLDLPGVQCIQPITYTLSDIAKIIEIEGNTLRFKTHVQSSNPELSGYLFDVSGEYSEGCNQSHLKILFETSLIVEKNKYTSFYIAIPKSIHSTQFSWLGQTTRKDKFLNTIDSCSKQYYLACSLSILLKADDGRDLDYSGSLLQK